MSYIDAHLRPFIRYLDCFLASRFRSYVILYMRIDLEKAEAALLLLVAAALAVAARLAVAAALLLLLLLLLALALGTAGGATGGAADGFGHLYLIRLFLF